jgi:hypothetical protein
MQTRIAVNVYEGDNAVASKNMLLESFTISGLPALPKQQAMVSVQFDLTCDGVLNVDVIDLSQPGREKTTRKIKINRVDASENKGLNFPAQHRSRLDRVWKKAYSLRNYIAKSSMHNKHGLLKLMEMHTTRLERIVGADLSTSLLDGGNDAVSAVEQALENLAMIAK